jgi:hypothetical protein
MDEAPSPSPLLALSPSLLLLSPPLATSALPSAPLPAPLLAPPPVSLSVLPSPPLSAGLLFDDVPQANASATVSEDPNNALTPFMGS